MKQAIDVAHRAFADWSRTTPLRRARVMFNFKALLEQHRDELAALIVSEHGKVYSDALGELTRGIEVLNSPAAFRTSSRASIRRTSAAALTASR